MPTGATEIFDLVVGDRGRLVLPAAVRQRLGIEQGTAVRLFVDDDGARLQSRAALAESGMGMYRHLAPEGGVVDAFIAERHAEASRENEV